LLLKVLDNLGQVADKQKQIANSGGALGTGFGIATGDMADKTTLMHQNIDSLYDAMSSPALPFFTGAISRLTGVIQGATSASEKHSTVTSAAVIGMSILGTGVYSAVSAMSTLGAASVFAGQGFKAVGWAMKLMRSDNFKAILSAINPITIGTKLWAGAQWLLNAAMDANPIVLMVAAAVALVVAAYEIYEHWSAIAGFFKRAWGDIKGIFTEAWGWMKDAGLNLMKNLGEGILAGIEWPFKAAEKVGTMILDHFKMHSPAKIGPLHDFHDLGISETIARWITPAPIVAAARRTAAVVAFAAPMMLGAGVPAMAATGAPGGAPGIVINAPITINAGTGDPAALEKIVVKAFERHRYELVKIMESELERRERSKL